MTPKEKAKELFNKFFVFQIDEFTAESEDGEEITLDVPADIQMPIAKQCALIAVDEIIKCTWLEKTYNEWGVVGIIWYTTSEFWLKVKEEINKL